MEENKSNAYNHQFAVSERGKTVGRLYRSKQDVNSAREKQTLIYAVSQDTEEALKKTAEIDRLVDLLRHAAPHEEKIESMFLREY
ncbi:hypothetical protein SAY87_011322 [Trapa incisa]|uniref:Uncharacterized protein n=1 Tax=Trapa incisa TaxID=236973 RepID=A0AAN7GFE3_9MYRT|nr:hypothetical protein SAY87_011322 [Trapa incisa]